MQTTTSFPSWAASQSYGQLRSFLGECTTGLPPIKFPRVQQKHLLLAMIDRWLLEAQKPTKDRKRDKAAAEAGRRFLVLMEQRKVTM